MRRSDMSKGIGAYANRPGYFLGGMVGGAILGALVNKIQGKDWKRGAIMGGIGGGVLGGLTGSGGFLGSKAGKAWLAKDPGLMKNMLSYAATNPWATGAIGAGTAYIAGDPEYDKEKAEEAMLAELEARKKRNMEMYSDWYNNPWDSWNTPQYASGGLARLKYAAGGPTPGPFSEMEVNEEMIDVSPMTNQGGIMSLDDLEEYSETFDTSGLSTDETSELQMLQMLKLVTPENDPKYPRIEMRIQELMNQLGQETSMSMPHPDDEWQQMMDNFLLDNPGMEFQDLDDFKQWYMDNADFSPMDYAADGGLMKRPGYMSGGLSFDLLNDDQKEIYSGLINQGYSEDEALKLILDPGPEFLRSPALEKAQGGLMRVHAKDGLWANIHAKRKRIEGGSGEKMRAPGSKGAPTAKALRESQAYGGMTGEVIEGVTEMDMTAGGASNGPGTGTSDEIPAMLSDGEFVVTAKAVENLGGGDRMLGAKRMYQMMNSLDPNSQTPAEMMTAGRT